VHSSASSAHTACTALVPAKSVAGRDQLSLTSKRCWVPQLQKFRCCSLEPYQIRTARQLTGDGCCCARQELNPHPVGSKTLSCSIAAVWVPLQLRALCLLVCSSTSAPCKHLVCLQSRSSHYLALQQPSPQCLSTVREIKQYAVPCMARQPAVRSAQDRGRCVSACKATAPNIPQDWTRSFT
jgi:hypothetical protein